jgi:putative transposase
MWSGVGQQVEIPTPGKEQRASGIGAVKYHTGETGMVTSKHKKKPDIASMLRQLVKQHSTGTIYLVLDNSATHFDDDIDIVLKEAQGRLILLYLPTYSPWLNPIEMLWRSMRYAVTHCELFDSLDDLRCAFLDYFATVPKDEVRSIIGSKSA